MKYTQELIEKAMKCKDAEELLALAKAEGSDLTKEEAEKFFAVSMNDELGLDDMELVAGGRHLSCSTYEGC